MVRAHDLSELCGAEIWSKLEILQPTGASKLRGATNTILQQNEDERKREVWASSTGNLGRAVAYAALQQNIQAVICLSKLVPENKVKVIESLRGDVLIIDKSQDEAEAVQLAKEVSFQFF